MAEVAAVGLMNLLLIGPHRLSFRSAPAPCRCSYSTRALTVTARHAQVPASMMKKSPSSPYLQSSSSSPSGT